MRYWIPSQGWHWTSRYHNRLAKIALHKSEFDVHVTVHCDKFLKTKPTRWTNFSNLFLEWNSTRFGHFLCPPSGVFHCTHSNALCHTGLLTAASRSKCTCSQALSNNPVWHIPLLCVQWKIPDDGQRKCPKHVEFHSKNKFEKLMHLAGFILRNTNQSAKSYKYFYFQCIKYSSYRKMLQMTPVYKA